MNLVHSSPLKNTALRLTQAIQSSQNSKKGNRKGNPINWPHYHSWKQDWFSLFYDEPNKGFKIEANKLILSLGKGLDQKRRRVIVDLPEAHILKDKKIRNLRITCELDEYFVIFSLQKDFPNAKPIDNVIALDPNHKNLCYGVDTKKEAIEIASPNWLKKFDKRIDEIRSKRDACQKKSIKKEVLTLDGKPTGKSYYIPSRKWKKFDVILKKALKKRREQTKTFMYTLANKLFKKYDVVAIGDYTPHGEGITRPMRRAMNNRSLIGRFKKVLKWVSKKSSKTYVEYDEKGTTRTCHHCNHIVEGGIPLSVRKWQCPQCQTEHIRDENAAINGLKKTMKELSLEESLSQVPSSGLVEKRWALCVLPSGVRMTLRGQDSEAIHSIRKLKRERDSSRSEFGRICSV